MAIFSTKRNLATARTVIRSGVIVLVVVFLSKYFFDFNDLQSKTDFEVRQQLDHSPHIDDRIKIVYFDDQTVEYIENRFPGLYFWADLFKALEQKSPRAILIAKIFGLPEGKQEEIDKAIKILENLKTPVISIGYTKEVDLVTREDKPSKEKGLPLKGASYQLQGPTLSADGFLSELPHFRRAYGKHERLHGVRMDVGHFGVDWSQSRYTNLIYRIGQDQVFPHFALLALGHFDLKDQGLFYNDKKIPTLEGGRVLFNHLRYPGDYLNPARAFSVKVFINEKKKSLEEIKPGDYVYIVPQFFTGGIERWVETPGGMTPKFLLGIPILNSLLTDQWITMIPTSEHILWVVAFALLGALIGNSFSLGMSFFLTSMTMMIVSGMGVFLFAFADKTFPWLNLIAGFGLSGSANLISRGVTIETTSKKMRRALSGLLPPSQVEVALKDPSVLDMRPEERRVSIMFLDMVGFSKISETRDHELLFEDIRAYIQRITRIVFKWNGVVNKTLGDGMVCFFGFRFDSPGHYPHSSFDAVQCALEVQRMCFQTIVSEKLAGHPVIPLRIGVNTDKVIIGNLGGDARIDITMIGDGVNYASRLETACEPFKVMIGQEVYNDLLGAEYPNLPPIASRWVQIKHFAELREAFEINPFHEAPDQLRALRQAYWEYSKDRQAEPRYTLPLKAKLVLILENDEFNVMDFSLSGFSISGQVFYARGVTRNATLKSLDGSVERKLESEHLHPFLVEIRSGYQMEKNLFVMGLKLPGINDQQKQVIFDACLALYQQSLPSASSS